MLTKLASSIGGFVTKSFDTPVKCIAGAFGAVVAWVEPVIPFLALCTFFVFIDCLSAWMLARRVSRQHPEQSRGSQFRSEYASEIFNTLAIIYFLVFGAYWLDEVIFAMFTIHLGNWIAGAFCLVQIVSILENCSSCNGATWAIVIQKILADKTTRHLKIDINKMVQEAKKEKENLPPTPSQEGESHTDTPSLTESVGVGIFIFFLLSCSSHSSLTSTSTTTQDLTVQSLDSQLTTHNSQLTSISSLSQLAWYDLHLDRTLWSLPDSAGRQYPLVTESIDRKGGNHVTQHDSTAGVAASVSNHVTKTQENDHLANNTDIHTQRDTTSYPNFPWAFIGIIAIIVMCIVVYSNNMKPPDNSFLNS